MKDDLLLVVDFRFVAEDVSILGLCMILSSLPRRGYTRLLLTGLTKRDMVYCSLEDNRQWSRRWMEGEVKTRHTQ